ncbi:MAG: hypothetical protein OXF94_06765, partial [Gammaproteobacteria bacterium]|nr:hypothetical protein [Gammaproteobacteria bacterium]
DASNLNALMVELVDRFGPAPEQALNLFRQARIQQRMRELGIRALRASDRGGEAEFYDGTPVDPLHLAALARQQPEEYALRPRGALRFRADLSKPERRFRYVERLLASLEEARRSETVH